MCGIAGAVFWEPRGEGPTRAALELMAGALTHRGPDEYGVYRDRTAGLAHARLSIIDLKTGQQPLANEDETLWIAFNGEIFNYLELREELEARGHRFRTRSDTEVVVHAWEEWDEEALRRFNGQWALSLWDRRRRELVLTRDRVGILPLYLVHQGHRSIFGSELKAIFAATPDLERALDPHGLVQTFTFWSTVPPSSIFKGVTEIRPGHVVRITDGRMLDRAYYRERYPTAGAGGFAGDLEEAVEAVAGALFRATALRMLRADVPVGCYLSGGLDSSLTTALGLQAKGESFHTFSLRFEDAEYDETRYQRLLAGRLGTEHHEIVVSRRDIADVFPEVIRHTERPILRTAPAPLFLLSRLVRATGIKVVLTGEGSDEVFAGYDIFREGIIRRFWAAHPDSPEVTPMLQRLYPYLARSPVSRGAMARHFFGQGLERWDEPGFAHGLRWGTTGALTRLLAAPICEAMKERDVTAELLADLPADFRRWTPLAQDQHLEMRTLLAGYLLSSQGDRMLMAHSVEGRFPFLDPEVMELAHSLPDDYKVHDLDEKHVLKRLGRAFLPEEILNRPKQPYRAPDALSFVGAGAPAWVEEILGEDMLREAGVFDVAAVRRLYEKCKTRSAEGQFSNTDNMALVGVLSTQLVHLHFVRRAPEASRPAVVHTLVDRVNA